jgi:hypothetical protein
VTDFRVLITGSRTWTDPAAIHEALDTVTAAAGGITLVHGGAGRGADAIASNWAAVRKRAGWPVAVERYPADWGRYGTRAGMIRNAEMVKAGADLVLAFIRDNSRGATHCAGLAEKAGIETRIYRWDDRSSTGGGPDA